MKILAIGDFHGELPKKFEKIAKKEKIDLILSTGDFIPFHYRKLWFKHCFRKDAELWEIIGKKKYKSLIKKDVQSGTNAIRKLKNLNIPIITVLGNIDWPLADDVKDGEKRTGKKFWRWDYTRGLKFAKIIKNYEIKIIDYNFAKANDFVFIGARGHSFSGRVKSKAYKKHKQILCRLFNQFKEENKNKKVIFLSHNVPYNTKLDLITSREADKKVIKKHYGSKLVRRTIEKYQPVLHIGGHIHESKGRDKIGKTLCISPGAVHDGQGAIIDLTKGIKIRFIK